MCFMNQAWSSYESEYKVWTHDDSDQWSNIVDLYGKTFIEY